MTEEAALRGMGERSGRVAGGVATHSMSDRERVARAICLAEWEDPDRIAYPWKEHDMRRLWETRLGAADAAIEAMKGTDRNG